AIDDRMSLLDFVSLVMDRRNQNLAELCEEELRLGKSIDALHLLPCQKTKRGIEITLQEGDPAPLRIDRWKMRCKIIALAQRDVVAEGTSRLCCARVSRQKEHLDSEDQSEASLIRREMQMRKALDGCATLQQLRPGAIVEIGKELCGYRCECRCELPPGGS